MKNWQLISMFLLVGCLHAAGQNRVIDSLLNVLKTEKEDSNKVNTLNGLSDQLEDISKYDSSLVCASNAQVLAEKIGFKRGLAAAFRNAGVVQNDYGNYSSSLVYYFKSLAINQEIGNKTGIALNLGNIGAVYYYKGDYANALDYESKALKVDYEIGNKNGIAINAGNIGIVYSYQGNYTKALDYYLKALKINEEIKNQHHIANNLTNIGSIYKDQHDYQNALDYYFKGLKINEAIGDEDNIAGDLTNIGNVYYHIATESKAKGEIAKSDSLYGRALDYYSKALKIDEEVGDKNNTSTNLGNFANVYVKQGQYSQALEFYLKALKIEEGIGDKSGIAIWLGDIGTLYTKTGDFKNAEEYLKKSITLDSTIGEQYELGMNEASICHLYDTTERYKLATVHYKKLITLKDSLFSIDKNKAMAHKEMAYELEKKDAADKAELDKKDAIALQVQQRQSVVLYSFIGGFILIMVLAFFIIVGYRQRQRANMAEINKQVVTMELRELKAQMDPHFLFNNLNTLTHLVEVKSDDAPEFVTELSKYYRYSLQFRNAEFTMLEEELKQAYRYIHILKIRFGDNMKIRWNINEAYRNHFIATYSLQLLFENITKHNIVSADKPLWVEITTTEKGTLIIRNQLQLKNSSALSNKHGLKSIEQRYQLLTSKKVIISQTQSYFSVELPLLTPSEYEDITG